MSVNVAALLEEAAGRVGTRPAIVEPSGRSISFADLQARVAAQAAAWSRRDLGPGDRVVVMVPMGIDLYIAVLSLLRMGAVAVFLDPWIGFHRLASWAAMARPRLVLCTGPACALRWFHRDLQRLPFLRVRRALAEAGSPVRSPLAEVGPESPALVSFTSGSSGRPKGVNRTHGFLRAQHEALAHAFPYPDDAVDLTMFPVFALHNLAQGRTTVVPAFNLRKVGRASPDRIVEQIRRHGVSTATLSPSVVDRLAGYGHAREVALQRLITGGAPVTGGQAAWWQSVWPTTEIQVAYGSTEAEPVAHLRVEERVVLAGRDDLPAPGICMGTPLPGVDARLIRIHPGPVALDAQGWEGWTPDKDGIGELVVRGAHVAQDYLDSPDDVSRHKIRDGDGRLWHRMGDTGYFDPSGRFWLAGRVHATLLRPGTPPVHLPLLEQAAMAAVPEADHMAVLADHHQDLVYVCETDAPRATIAKHLQEAGLPTGRVRVTRRPFPMDPRHHGKIDRDRLSRRVLGGRVRTNAA